MHIIYLFTFIQSIIYLFISIHICIYPFLYLLFDSAVQQIHNMTWNTISATILKCNQSHKTLLSNVNQNHPKFTISGAPKKSQSLSNLCANDSSDGSMHRRDFSVVPPFPHSFRRPSSAFPFISSFRILLLHRPFPPLSPYMQVFKPLSLFIKLHPSLPPPSSTFFFFDYLSFSLSTTITFNSLYYLFLSHSPFQRERLSITNSRDFFFCPCYLLLTST